VESGPDDTHRIMPDSRWDDLARNAPGESARTRAKELRAEHPFLVTTAKALGIRTSAGSFAMGARGEREVGRKLNRWAVQNGWHVLHAVPVGREGADIDHVVIASFGVVTVNTKTTKTRVWVGESGMTVGGKSVDYLRKSRAEAHRAGQLLGRATGIAVPVQAVIVFTGAHRFSVRRGGPPDIAVLAAPRAARMAAKAAIRTWQRAGRSHLPGRPRSRHLAGPKESAILMTCGRRDDVHPAFGSRQPATCPPGSGTRQGEGCWRYQRGARSRFPIARS